MRIEARLYWNGPDIGRQESGEKPACQQMRPDWEATLSATGDRALNSTSSSAASVGTPVFQFHVNRATLAYYPLEGLTQLCDFKPLVPLAIGLCSRGTVPSAAQKSTRSPLGVVLALDNSGSLKKNDPLPAVQTRAKRASGEIS